MMKKEIYYKITDAKTLRDEYDHIYSLYQADQTLAELENNDKLSGAERKYYILKVIVKRHFDNNNNFLREEMFTTRVLTHEEIKKIVDAHIDSIFCDLQEMVGIKSGDITPLDQFDMEQITTQLTSEMTALIRKVLDSQELYLDFVELW